MSVFLYTMNKKASLPVKPPLTVEVKDIGLLKSHKPGPDDMTYLDAQGLDDEARRKAVLATRRRCGEAPWGVADPKGLLEDPAALFFSGASDYLGPAACKAGLDKARIKAILAFRRSRSEPGAEKAEAPSCPEAAPEGRFPGWKSVSPGVVYPFCFLYVSASAQVNLKTRLGEAGFVAFRDRLRTQLQQGLAEADPLLWMETESSALYLVPPYASHIGAAAEACLRMLLGAPLVGYERLCLPFPLDFSFAMHYGSTEFAPPGKTGTIVSDAVNYSYHLGAKRAEPGRLTVSAEAAPLVVSPRIEDLFVPAGTFEGRAVVHSRRFGAS